MKSMIRIMIALLICMSSGFGDELRLEDIVQAILLQCRSPEDPTPDAELADYARVHGLSNAEVSRILVSFIEDGLQGGGDNLQRQLTAGALSALARFGGEQEIDFVRSIVQTTEDAGLKRRAIFVGMRLSPEKWEEWIRYVATDNHFDSLTRFITYQEAYRIGKNKDELTRRRVEQVLSEFADKDPSPGNCEELRKWSADLKAR